MKLSKKGQMNFKFFKMKIVTLNYDLTLAFI